MESMDPDFYDQYKEYSTVELLKIIKRPEDYQDQAVDAAARVLRERQVLAKDVEDADQFFTDLEEKNKAASAKISFYKEKAADIFEPIIRPGTEVTLGKWLTLLIVAVGIEVVFTFYNFIKSQISFLRCEDCHWDSTLFVGYISIIYISIVFYLLLRKKRWGWILLMADSVISIMLGLSKLTVFRNQLFHRDDASVPILIIFIKGAFAVFLWRKEVSDLFGVMDPVRKRTVWVAAVLSVLFVLVLRSM